MEDLRSDIAKIDQSVQAFLSSHRGDDPPAAPWKGRRTNGSTGARGPRRAVEPRGDIKSRLSQVNQAYVSGNVNRAKALAFEIVRINSETHQAWSSLSAIFQEQGVLDKALTCMVYAAHLRPKDGAAWQRCADFALKEPNFQTARYCYSMCLRANPANIDARLGRARASHQLGQLPKAIEDFNYVLTRDPYRLDVVGELAEVCLDSKNLGSVVHSAISAYRRCFDHYRGIAQASDPSVSWQDLAIYAELLAGDGQFHDSISELKSLARWLLGRQSEVLWDDWQDDDREWDREDGRRIEVPGFNVSSFPQTTYGHGLPLELHAWLGFYRLRLGQRDEAMVCQCTILGAVSNNSMLTCSRGTCHGLIPMTKPREARYRTPLT
jgi:general transcription factor 3C polypeptide 3 (transcription factor C subunit 4)